MSDSPKAPGATDVRATHAQVDVLVIGGGVTGIYQLYLARQAGFSVKLLESGAGVGGTWFWNRYPEARFDSESYSYGYLFSKELWEEWEWSERFAGQPEIERYFNYAVDRFDLRRDMVFDAHVASADYDEPSGTWIVRTTGGAEFRSRFVIAATGILSVPHIPDIPGRGDFGGEQHHTGQWPKTHPVFSGKRVALVGTGSSGVQIVPAIADDVASLTVYQRTPDWCTPLNNAPIGSEEQSELKANFETIRATLNSSPSGFLHPINMRRAAEDTAEQRQVFYEKMWNGPGFTKLTENYMDMTTDATANAEWCEFITRKIRGIVKNPQTADKLIPKDHGYAGRRPPFGTGYYETYNKPNVSLVSLRETPITRITERGIETADGLQEFDIIIWATGYDFGTGALNRLGVRGRQGLALEDYWADGPRTYLGVAAAGFPNFFFPGGPHGATGNNPRYSGDQADFVIDALVHAREHGHEVVEVDATAEDRWTEMMNSSESQSSFLKSSYFYGANIPGKPVRQLLNPTGRWTLQKMIGEAIEGGYPDFTFSKTTEATV